MSSKEPFKDYTKTPSQPVGRKTAAEKQWLKENHGDEFRFLRNFGLSIYKDEHREEGRAIMRSFMAQDESIADDNNVTHEHILDDPVSISENEVDHYPRLEQEEFDQRDSNLEGHVTDHLFTETQLDKIGEEYGDSLTFMSSFGLKSYDHSDGEEARQIADQLFEDNDVEYHNDVEYYNDVENYNDVEYHDNPEPYDNGYY